MDIEILRSHLADLGVRPTLFPLRNKIPAVKGWTTIPAGEDHSCPGMDAGILLGEPSGAIVVDCDTAEAAKAFVATYGPIETFTVETRRGVHFYFQWPGWRVPTSHSKLMPKVDIQGDGSQVAAPGSRDKVVALDLPIAPMPAALQTWIQDHAVVRAPPTPATPIDMTTDEGHRRRMKAIEYLRTAAPCVANQGGDAQLWFVCLHLTRKLELPLDVAEDLLVEHYNPRCQPPWPPDRIQYKLLEAQSKGEMATTTQVEAVIGALRKTATAPVDRPAGSGKPTTPDLNLMQAMLTSGEWEGVFRFNVATRQAVAVNPPLDISMAYGGVTDGDLMKLRMWFEQQGCKAPSKEDVVGVIAAICETKGNEYNPFLEYLNSLPPVSPGLLDLIHSEVLNSSDGPMASRIFKRQLVAAVRVQRALPGLHEDLRPVAHRLVVILAGDQSTGKTSLLRQLAGKWYASIGGDVKDKDERIRLVGSVFVEMEEMATAKKTDRTDLKKFISNTLDKDRHAYGRSPLAVQRSYVLFGTTNELIFEDPTGHTRFAPIQVGKMCGEKRLLELRDAIWSEANALEATGYSHHLDDEEKAWCAERCQQHEVDDMMVDQLPHLLRGVTFVTLTEAWQMLVQDPKKIASTPEHWRLVTALKRVGCKPFRWKGVKRGWLVPEDLAFSGTPRASQWLNDTEASLARKEILEARGAN